MKIGVFHTGALGDTLFMTPFVRGLRKTFPSSKIVFIASENQELIIKGNLNIDKMIIYPITPISKNVWNVGARFLKIFKLWIKLKKEKFDIIFTNDRKGISNLFLFTLGIPERVGISLSNKNKFLTKSVEFKEIKHQIVYNNSLLSFFTDEKFSKKNEIIFNKKRN